MKNSILIICSLFFCNLSTAMNPDIFVCDREQDSLALVQFYGQLTTLSWDLTQPIDSFEGVTLNAEGCVEKISITSGVAGGNFPNVSLPHIKELRIAGFGSGNCSVIDNLEIFNDIPDFCCMPQLEKLTLRMFKAGSPIPNFSNLPKLKHLEIVARAITGPLPDFSNCPELETLVISGYTTTWIFSCVNRRTGINGGIPNYNLPNLNFLTMRINRLNGDLPDFSNMPSTATINVSNNYIENIPALNTNALINVTQNYFTFEDLLPHLDNFSNYAPQHLIPVEPLIRINDNGNPEIDIQFDADVQGSTYIWFKDNVQIGTTTTNRLEIPDPAEVNGLYKVTVTNPGAPALTLMTEDFNVVFCEHFVGAQPILVEASICEGEMYTLPDSTVVTTAGDYETVLVSSFGCDSIIQTQLLVHESEFEMIEASICNGESYLLPDGSEVSEAGSYPVDFININGCDSTILTLLTLETSDTSEVEAYICEDEIYTLDDGTEVTEAGTYEVVLSNAAGCDSIIITMLDLREHTMEVVDVFICEGESYTLPDGVVVNESAAYESIIANEAGCDSIILTKLTVLEHSFDTLEVEICEGSVYQLPDGSEVDEAGSYEAVIENVNGCDSTILVALSLSQAVVLSEVELIPESDAMANGSITPVFSGGVEPLQFEWSTGDTTGSIEGLTAGTYWLVVTDGFGCTYTFEFEVEMITATEELENLKFRLYPNPFREYIILEMESEDDLAIRLFDVAGRQIPANWERTGQQIQINTQNVPHGAYFLQILQGDRKRTSEIIIKH